MIRMSVSILFGFGDDFHFDEGAEVNGGLGSLEDDNDFRLVEVRLFAIERREDSLKECLSVTDEEQGGDFIFNHLW